MIKRYIPCTFIFLFLNLHSYITSNRNAHNSVRISISCSNDKTRLQPAALRASKGRDQCGLKGSFKCGCPCPFRFDSDIKTISRMLFSPLKNLNIIV